MHVYVGRKKQTGVVVRRRLTGVVFLAAIVGLLTLSIAVYNKAFTDTVEVTVRTDHTGNQLRKSADVKQRGVIVGSVKKVTSTGDGAIVTLALKPSAVGRIPSDVQAQILPKTLFGEQYVALEERTTTAQVRAIRAGDVIEQDTATQSLETQEVLGNLLPVLDAIDPAQLNVTLTAMADSLRGHGTELGTLLKSLDAYLQQLNTDTGTGASYTQELVTDLQKLGQVALVYNEAAPRIADTLDSLRTSLDTLSAKKPQLSSLLAAATDTSNATRTFLAENKQAIAQVATDWSQINSLLEEYAPEYGCVLSAMSDVENLAANGYDNGQIHLGMVLNNDNMGPYKPGEQPRLVTGYGPHCFGLPDNPQPQKNGNFQMPSDMLCLNDGTWFVPDCPAERRP